MAETTALVARPWATVWSMGHSTLELPFQGTHTRTWLGRAHLVWEMCVDGHLAPQSLWHIKLPLPYQVQVEAAAVHQLLACSQALKHAVVVAPAQSPGPDMHTCGQTAIARVSMLHVTAAVVEELQEHGSAVLWHI